MPEQPKRDTEEARERQRAHARALFEPPEKSKQGAAEKTEQTPPAETREERERREEKERVLTALHAWYELENVNTPMQRELAEKTETLKKTLTDFLPYMKEYDASLSNPLKNLGVYEGFYSDGYGNLAIAGENASDASNERRGWPANDSSRYSILRALETKYFEKYREQKKFQEIAAELTRVIHAIMRLRDELVGHQKKVFQEVLHTSVYGALLSLPGKFSYYNKGKPYCLQGGWEWELEQPTEFAGWEGQSYIRVGDAVVDKIKEKLGITDEEIQNVKEIMWSPEEQEKIERLKRAVQVYWERWPETNPQKSDFNDNSDQEYQLIRSMKTAGFARIAYDKLELPTVHKERALTELKLQGKILLN